jgi:predicted amidohydrolase
VYARLETSNFRTLGNFRNSLDWASPNQEENSQLVLTPEAAIAAFCILALALFESDAANTAVQAPAAAADAQRIEAVIATIASNRPNRC